MGRISPKRGFRPVGRGEGLREVGERFVIDLEACWLVIIVGFFGGGERVAVDREGFLSCLSGVARGR
jgi:hypothetical protein